jgi:hypothetical protein
MTRQDFANGMFGTVVIDPPGLPAVDCEYLLAQSELYLGANGETANPAKVNAERPDAVVFNGFADQYDHDQLAARIGERVRVWVLDAGPSQASSFHVVGGQLDTVFKRGSLPARPRLRGCGGVKSGGVGGAQALALQPAQGGFTELTVPEAGTTRSCRTSWSTPSAGRTASCRRRLTAPCRFVRAPRPAAAGPRSGDRNPASRHTKAVAVRRLWLR